MPNKANDRQHARHKGKYAAQRVRTAKNKLAACKRHVVKHPNDSFGVAQLQRRMRGEV